jgi:hypothetical protein
VGGDQEGEEEGVISGLVSTTRSNASNAIDDRAQVFQWSTCLFLWHYAARRSAIHRPFECLTILRVAKTSIGAVRCLRSLTRPVRIMFDTTGIIASEKSTTNSIHMLSRRSEMCAGAGRPKNGLIFAERRVYARRRPTNL